uniref:NACHT domain-containing protein n=1 Tax=Anopheles dirus TaxID=7168 RepID=A0A182NW67_9DIPT
MEISLTNHDHSLQTTKICELQTPMTSKGKQSNSSLHGSSYHLRLALTILLRAFKQHLEDKSLHFMVTLEDAAAGKFDDIIFRYSSSSGATGTVFIQAKHKQATYNYDSTPASPYRADCNTKTTAMVTRSALLTEWHSKSPFSIPMYFLSFLEHYDPAAISTSTYMLCTNANVDRHVEQYLQEKKYDNSHMLAFCNDIGARCFQFRGGTSNELLNEKLRDSSVEYLGKQMALHVFKKTTVKFNTNIFIVHANLIAKLIEYVAHDKQDRDSVHVFEFKNDILCAEESTAVGKFRRAFEAEYSKHLKSNNQDDVWHDAQEKKMKISLNYLTYTAADRFRALVVSRSDSVTIDTIIEEFYEKFMLVCNSANEEDLCNASLNLMPSWVNNKQIAFNDLQALIFDGMKSTTPGPIDQEYLKARFMEINPNENNTQLQILTKKYLESLRLLYPYFCIQPDRLKDSILYQFVSDATCTGIYQYRSTMNVEQSSIILAQTIQLIQCNCLFIDSASYECTADIISVLRDTLEYISDVNHTYHKFVAIIGKFDRNELKEIQKLALKCKQKVIILTSIATSFQDDLDDDYLIVSDLTEDAQLQLYKQYDEINMHGTSTSLIKILSNHDSLCFLFKLLQFCTENEHKMAKQTNKSSYESIESWYIPRVFVPYSEREESYDDDHEDIAYTCSADSPEIRFEEISFLSDQTIPFVQSAISSSDSMLDPPGCVANEKDRKVFILLNDAGNGKSTYFTWLAWRLSSCNPSLHVVRLNALQYSTDFSRLKSTNLDSISDTQVITILYSLVHLALFVPNFTSRSTAETDVERAVAERCAKLLAYTEGKITINEKHHDGFNLSAKQRLELRIFQEKFNSNQLVLLLDGFDEISPHYKDIVLKTFARIARFEQIRHLYISSRPVDFKTDFDKTFSNCGMYMLKPFSQKNQILYFHKYLLRELDGYSQCEELQQILVLSVLFITMTDHINTLRSIPFFLNIAFSIFLPITKENINFHNQTLARKLIWQNKFDRLQLLKNYVVNKIKISETEKLGTEDFVLYTTTHLSRLDKFIRQIEEQHALLSLFVMFDDGCVSTLLSHQEQQKAIEYMQEIVMGHEKTGFVSGIKDGIPQFTHRMFAEYFAACWLYLHKDRIKKDHFFRSKAFWTDELRGLRDFFDRMIASESQRCDIHIALLNRSEDQVLEMLRESPSVALIKDAEGRLPLHFAVLNRCFATVEALAATMTPRSINIPDKLLQWTALDYAFAAGYEGIVKTLLKLRAEVNVDNLTQQIAPNNWKQLLKDTEIYRNLLDEHENTKTTATELLVQIVTKFLTKNEYNIDAKTILKICIECKMTAIFIEYLSHVDNPQVYFTETEPFWLLKMAFKHKAHGIMNFLIDTLCLPIVAVTDTQDLMSALQWTMEQNKIKSFGAIFEYLCFLHHIPHFKHLVIDENLSVHNDLYLPALEEDCYQKVCCAHDSKNCRFTLIAFDESIFVQYLGSAVLGGILAKAIHDGNISIISYIIPKTNMFITNNLILMFMDLLFENKDVCHHKSIPAFKYLLDNSIDLNSIDDEGQTLLHSIIQNGYYFLLHYLIAKGFDVTQTNTTNGWNVLHYVVFDENIDRANKTMECLLQYESIIWFDLLDSMLNSYVTICNDRGSINDTKQNTAIFKHQHALLAMYAILDDESRTQLLCMQEKQEAIEHMRAIESGQEKSRFIEGVQDDIPRYSDRIYADYFVASWLYENRNRISKRSFILSKPYWSEDLCRVRDFFDRMILRASKSCELHMAIINRSTDQVCMLLSHNSSVAFQKDAVLRTPLHLAVQKKSSLTEMLAQMSPNVVNELDMFNWCALEYAFITGYKDSIQILLQRGALVNVSILLKQIISNTIDQFLIDANDYCTILNSNEQSYSHANHFIFQAFNYLLDAKQIDLSYRYDELSGLTVLEYCVNNNCAEMFKGIVSLQMEQKKFSDKQAEPLLRMAIDIQSFDIITYLINQFNTLLLPITDATCLIPALKYSIEQNRMKSFRIIFIQLCFQRNISLVNDKPNYKNVTIPAINRQQQIKEIHKHHYPKVCCALSAKNDGFQMPEYDAKDNIHDGHLIEALIAKSVHEGNIPTISYIVEKTDIIITHQLIVKVMRLLPKGKGICHDKSIPAFKYLLDIATDINRTDKEGRNLLHMTAQHGCFFMFHCLINSRKGFNPTNINPNNQWNVFHYVALDETEDRSSKILEYLMQHYRINWFDFFKFHDDEMISQNLFRNNLAFWNYRSSSQLYIKDLYAILAINTIFGNECKAKLLSKREQRQANECLLHLATLESTGIIKEVQNNIATFSHRIFAEHFAASWLNKNRNRMRNESFFRSRSYWTRDLLRMRDLFDWMVVRESKGCIMHMAVLNRSTDQLTNLLLQNPSSVLVKDAVGRSLLHLAVQKDLQITDLLYSKLITLKSLNERDQLFYWSPLDYAFINGKDDLVKSLIELGAEIHEEVLFQQITSNDLRELLFVANRYGKYLKYNKSTTMAANRLHNQVTDYLLKKRKLNLNNVYEELDSLPVLPFCVKYKLIEMMELFRYHQIHTQLSSAVV